jgi:outer membrane protein OmpA-like peptidoglycan-associated protein
MALYQALNAIQIAQAEGGDRYAPDQLARARLLYNKARTFPVHLSKEIVSMSREATQIAEDSRAISVRRADAEKAAVARVAAETKGTEPETQGEQPQAAVQPPAPQPRRQPVPGPEGGRTRIERAPQSTTQVPPVTVDHSQFLRDDPRAPENRRSLLVALPRTFDVVDSSRGIVMTLPVQDVSSLTQSYFAAIATAIRPYRNLHLKVEAHRDKPGSLAETRQDSERVRQGLISAGISPDVIAAAGYGDTRPRAPKGQAENSRVELTIAGDAIGTLPGWDRTYTLQPTPASR